MATLQSIQDSINDNLQPVIDDVKNKILNKLYPATDTAVAQIVKVVDFAENDIIPAINNAVTSIDNIEESVKNVEKWVITVGMITIVLLAILLVERAYVWFQHSRILRKHLPVHLHPNQLHKYTQKGTDYILDPIYNVFNMEPLGTVEPPPQDKHGYFDKKGHWHSAKQITQKHLPRKIKSKYT